MKKVSLWVMGGSILFAIAPIISVLIAGTTATAFDCTLNEASAHPCVVPLFGDIGELLAILGLMGWLALASIPLGIIGFLGGSLLFGISFFLRRKEAPELPLQN